MSTPARGLGDSARKALLLSGGATLIQDVAQFGVMLILVRLLSPADYGTAALAQAILGVAAVVSFGTFSAHALQMRNPQEIDWQAHFTAAAVLNIVLTGLVLALAFALSFTRHYAEAALPLAALAMVFLIEIPGTLRHRMLEANHDWKRLRVLLIIGTVLGLGSGLAVALMGGGVWALIVQVPLLGLPATIDLFFIQRFKPDWSWSWARWRKTFSFGLDRIGSGLVGRGRVLNEQMLLSGLYDLATLGVFSRASGLAMLIAGRIGSLTMQSLHPVVTRADGGSHSFQRMAGLVLRGVVWMTVPAAVFLGLAARDTVSLLYGAQWDSIVPLLPLAASAIGLGGIISALSSLLVANENSRSALSLDLLAAITGIPVAIVLIPYGAQPYLAGLSLHALVIGGVALGLVVRRGAMSGRGIAEAFVPAVVAASVGAASVTIVHCHIGASDILALRLLVDAAAFTVIYVATLRLAFTRPFAELLDLAAGDGHVRRMLRLA